MRNILASTLDPVLVNPQWRPAAVMLLIYGKIPHIIMTEKPQHMRIHAGEISFPGGKPEDMDTDLCDTALRETYEEIGCVVGRQSVIGQLAPVHTISSGFTILPFVAVQDHTPRMHANVEVNAILRIPLMPLLQTLEPDMAHGQDMFCLQYKDKNIWGASARILEQVRQRLCSTPETRRSVREKM